MMDALVYFILVLEAFLALLLLYREGLMKRTGAAVLCTVLVTLAFALRASVLPYETGDYTDFLARWVNHYRSGGGFRAFGELPYGCNYQVPYLYFLALFSYLPTRDLFLIKLLSCGFDVLLAWAAMKLAGRANPNPTMRMGCFFAVLFWPTVLMNGALWGQCDSIYVAFALLGILLALEDRPVASMVMMALSFSFKLQAVFVLPVCASLWIYGKYKWQHFLVFPLTYVLVLLPAVLLGRPLWDTLIFYFKQTGSIGDALNYNSPSIFALLTGIPEARKSQASLVAIIAAALYMLNLIGLAYVMRKKLTDRAVLALALLMAVGLPFLLPHMHDRYFFPADVLSLALVFGFPMLLPVAPLVGFASFLGCYAYMSFYPFPSNPAISEFFAGKGPRYLLPMQYGAVALLIAIAMTALGFAFSLHTGSPQKKSSGKKPKKKKKA